MNIKLHLSLMILLVLLGGALQSCRNRPRDESAVKEPGRLYQYEFRKKLDGVNPGLTDPAGVITLLEMTGAEFIPGLVNDSELDPEYLSDSALLALNLGIYTVDLVYLLAYEQYEKADIQLERARSVAGRIGAGPLYDQGMYRRFRQAGVPSDTLILYFSRAAEALEQEFTTMELLRLYTLFATGEFIEKLYLSTRLLIHAEKSETDQYWTIMLLVFQQEQALDNLILLLDQIRYRDEGERFMAMMKDLKHIYMELNSRDVMAGINTGNITEYQAFTDLAEQIGKIRDRVIHPE